MAVTIKNTSTSKTVAFFLRPHSPRQRPALAVSWSDNDITLWPGESETLTVSYKQGELHGGSPVISVAGWNVPAVNVSGG